jgi:hypothetical protein
MRREKMLSEASDENIIIVYVCYVCLYFAIILIQQMNRGAIKIKIIRLRKVV